MCTAFVLPLYYHSLKMTSEALLFTLSAIGISETVYLIKKRLLFQKPICFLGQHCQVVLDSRYSKMFIIPNDVLGLLFYITCSAVTVLLVIEVGHVSLFSSIMNVLVTSGSLISLYFVYLQFKVIKVWCFWCLMSALTIWLMGVILLSSNLIT